MIELNEGENLSIKTPRGNLVLRWYDEDSLLVCVAFDPETTEPTVNDRVGDEFKDLPQLKPACGVWLWKKAKTDE